MAETCWMCKFEVSWGTPICPQCGTALEWEEGDDEDHLAAMMPPDWEDNKNYVNWRIGLLRPYVIGSVVIGLLLIGIGLAGGLVWWLLLAGVLILGLGVFAGLTLPTRYD